ncbi:MAG: peptide deformylase [Planctomycetota bacterium]
MTEPREFELSFFPDPVLRKSTARVERFDDELGAIAAGMVQRMHASRGVGLAAPQVGLGVRIFVMSPEGKEGDETVMVNPEILSRGRTVTTYEEGCLSFPGIFAEILRPEDCAVRYQTVLGETIEESFGGFPSRVIQHEFDHLEGVLFTDRMTPADKQRLRRDLEELIETFKQKRG